MIYLIVPGLRNSGPLHWQSLWEQLFLLKPGAVSSYSFEEAGHLEDKAGFGP